MQFFNLRDSSLDHVLNERPSPLLLHDSVGCE